ncbi:MAG: acyltransferase [Chlorobia bacterium]|nr:acyltransferase [Fimbriimonadaceae bacterium]
MTIESPVGYFIGMAFALVVSWLLAKIPLFRHTTESQTGRFLALDGLRGFLAPAVIFHHILFFRNDAITGSYELSPTAMESIYRLLGPIPVAIFFLLTGFLFWDKALNSGGQMSALPLYRGRIRRIVPLYVFLVASVLLVTLLESGLTLRVSKGDLANELAYALSMGARTLPSINGVDVGGQAGAVTWTLGYEWRFYVILPLIAGLATLKKDTLWLLLAPFVLFGLNSHYVAYQWQFLAILVGIGFVAMLLRKNIWMYLVPFLFVGYDSMAMLFAFGMLAAHLVRIPRFKEILCTKVSAILVLMLVPTIWLVVGDGYSARAEALCFAVFLPIACGNDLFGLLRLTAARHLGAISYSVYLLHCLFMYLVFRTLGFGPYLASLEPLPFWLAMALVVGGIVVICTLTYHYIERPFIVHTVRPVNQVAKPEEATAR